MDIGSFALDRLPDPSPHSLVERQGCVGAHHGRRVVFLKNDEPAGAQPASELTEGVDGFGLVHEHPPANG